MSNSSIDQSKIDFLAKKFKEELEKSSCSSDVLEFLSSMCKEIPNVYQLGEVVKEIHFTRTL